MNESDQKNKQESKHPETLDVIRPKRIYNVKCAVPDLIIIGWLAKQIRYNCNNSSECSIETENMKEVK